MERGVLVGCDQAQEWLLSWWWKNYRQKNTLPVAFADFGMTEEARSWCQARGLVLPISVDGYRVALKKEIEEDLLREWELSISPFWESRQAWFKKPFAMLQSPFFETIWMDLDCEVLDSLDPIYPYLSSQSKIGLVRVRELDGTEGKVLYNSGVIVFEKEAPILKKWAEFSLFQNHRFLSDQDALSEIIFNEKFVVGEVPEIYNWLMCRGVHLGAKVLHWAAVWGKEYIRRHGGLKQEIAAAFLIDPFRN